MKRLDAREEVLRGACVGGCLGGVQGYSWGLPVREVISRKQSEPPGYGAYGYVLLSSRPSPETKKRYETFCRSYFRALEASEGRVEDRCSQMVTLWLVKSPITAGKRSSRDFYLDDYDYFRAAKILGNISKSGSCGPILVAWEHPFDANNPKSEALIFDLSDFLDEDFDRAFAIWRDRISRNPKLWENGFQLVLAREACRSLVQRYGYDILSIVNPKCTSSPN